MILFNRQYGEGEPLIILHGLFGQSDNLTTVAKALGVDFHVYVMDQRNHGQSGHDDTFNYKSMVDDLAETLNALKLEKIHLLGHSMGGKTAMLFTVNYPERILSLSVADIGPRYYSQHHQEIIDGLNSLKLDELESRSDAESKLLKYIPEIGTRQFLLKNLYRNESQKFAWRFNLPVISREIENVGEEIINEPVSIPTLFYSGSNSSYIKEADHEKIKSIFPLAEFKVMKDAGHWLHAENPEEFVKTIRGFILGR